MTKNKKQQISQADDHLLRVRDLKMYFPVLGGVFARKTGDIKAVDGISFDIKRGETLGLVGESGCGKSTVGRTLIRLYKPTAGTIEFATEPGTYVNLSDLDSSELRPYRAHIQMIFQDPYSSLNPRFTIGDIIDEPLKIHRSDLSKSQRWEIVISLLKKCGLSEEQAYRYPHEFSGGQRQRVGIARSLATNPQLIIADEPVSALDVSIQAQVINLMMDLQEEFNLTYIFIAHDLSVVKHISNRIAVMYLGHIVELGDADEVYFDPLHPYSKALLSAVPEINKQKKQRQILTGDVPSPMNKPSGCPFRTRCPIAKADCAATVPPLVEIAPGRYVACLYA